MKRQRARSDGRPRYNPDVPKTITVRDLPPETHAELKRRAAEKGQSLQEFLLDFLMDLVSRPDPEDEIERRRPAEQERSSPETGT